MPRLPSLLAERGASRSPSSRRSAAVARRKEARTTSTTLSACTMRTRSRRRSAWRDACLSRTPATRIPQARVDPLRWAPSQARSVYGRSSVRVRSSLCPALGFCGLSVDICSHPTLCISPACFTSDYGGEPGPWPTVSSSFGMCMHRSLWSPVFVVTSTHTACPTLRYLVDFTSPFRAI